MSLENHLSGHGEMEKIGNTSCAKARGETS